MGNPLDKYLPIVKDDIKRGYAATETSGDISGDWLQLEKLTFNDLKKRKKIRPEIQFEGLKDRPQEYDEVAKSYIDDTMKTFKIPTKEEAILWSWRPGWYQKYGGDIEKIPPEVKGVFGKKAIEVMRDRKKNLEDAKKKFNLDLSLLNPFKVEEAQASEENPLNKYLQQTTPIKNPLDKYLGAEVGAQAGIPKHPSFISVPPERQRYHRPLTDEERAGAVVDLINKETGGKLTPDAKLDRFLKSPEMKKVAQTLVMPYWTGLEAMRGLMGAVSPNVSIPHMIVDSMKKGVLEPGKVEPTSVAIMKAYPNANWQTAGLIGTLAEIAVVAPVLFNSVTKSLVRGVSKEGQFAQSLKAIRRTSQWKKTVEYYTSNAQQRGMNISAQEVDNALTREMWKLKGNVKYSKLVVKNIKRGLNIGRKGMARIGGEGKLPKGAEKNIPSAIGGTKVLIEQAKKFKTAEEWVKSKDIVFHGSDKKIEKFDISKVTKWKKFGHFFTRQKNFAKLIGNEINEAIVELNNPKIISKEEWDDIRQEHAKDAEWFANWKKELKAQGFDGLKVEGGKEIFAGQEVENPEILVAFEDAQIKTKQQLTSIWEQAHKGKEIAKPSQQKNLAELTKYFEEVSKEPAPKDLSPEEEKQFEAEAIIAGFEDNNLYKRIKEHVGIKAYKNKYLKEELSQLPLFLKGKSPLDEMADELGFSSDSELLQAIEDFKPRAQEYRDSKKYLAELEKQGRQKSRRITAYVNKVKRILREKNAPTKFKQAIELSAGVKKLVDTITMKETQLLKIRIKEQAKGAEVGAKFGKQKQSELNKTQMTVTAQVDKLKRMAKSNIPSAYKDMVDSVLADLGIGKIKAKYKLKEFVNKMREQGELVLIDDKELEKADLITLNNVTLELLKEKVDIVKQIVFQGRNEKKTLSEKYSKHIGRISEAIEKSIQHNMKIVSSEGGGRKIILRGETQGLSPASKVNDTVDKFFSSLRKVEFISKTLDGFTHRGVMHHHIIKPVQDAGSNELVVNDKDLRAFKGILDKFSPKELDKIMKEKIKIKGIPEELTQEEAIGIYVNSFNEGNMERLEKGNGLEKYEVKFVRDYINTRPKLRAIGDHILNAAGSKWEAINKVKLVLTGDSLEKIEGRYFPIKTLKEFDKRGRLAEAEEDLFQNVMDVSKIKKGFTESRVGGNAPVDLKIFKVFINHIQDVNKYITHAIPVRDVQKILHNEKVRQAITNALGKNIYSQYIEWLKDVANPRRNLSNTGAEIFVDWMRRNSTQAILGVKVSVSLLQMGSFTQTINEIGLPAALDGLREFLQHPGQVKDFIYERAPQLKFRSKNFDRELRELMEHQSIKALIKGESLKGEVLFSLIRTIDRMATLPTWKGAYNKELMRTRNENKAIAYASHVVRITQPAGMVKDLAQIARGRAFQKIFVMFYTHYSNYHNNMVLAKDRLKYGEDGKSKRGINFTTNLWWLVFAPVLYASVVRRGRLPTFTEIVKNSLSYSMAGIPLVRDVASRYAYGRAMPITSPAFAGLEFISRVLINKTHKLENIVRSTGYFSGLPTEQGVITTKGVIDLLNHNTTDPRRLIYNKYQLHNKTKKPVGTKSKFGKTQSRFGNKTSRFGKTQSRFGK